MQPAEMFKQTLSYATLHLYELLPRCKSEPTGAHEGSSQAECTGTKTELQMRLQQRLQDSHRLYTLRVHLGQNLLQAT